MTHAYSTALPKARTENLIIKELPDEVLIYDRNTDKAHCLNNSAALVWKQCDGETSIDAIASKIEAEQQTSVDEGFVWIALDQLKKFELLENVPLKPSCLKGVGRRQLIKNAGIAALALPLVVSITTPTAAQTASCPPPGCSTPGCIPSGCPCSPNGNNPLCSTGQCVGGTGLCQ